MCKHSFFVTLCKTITSCNKLAIVLILIAIFLRIYRFEGFITFLGDQGRDATIIKRILFFEHFPAIGAPSSVGQVYLGPFYYYLIAPFLVLFNFQPAGLAYGVFFISIASLIASYFIIKKEINTLTALFFLIFLTFSIANIDLSRYSWNPNLLPMFSFFTLYFFYKLVITNKTVFAVLFGSFLSFSIQLHYLALFLIIPLAFVFTQTIIKHKSKINFIKKILISVIFFFLFSSPLIVFDLRHNFLNAQNFINMFAKGEAISNSSPLTRFLETNRSFWQIIFKINLEQFVTLVPFLLLIIFYLCKYKKINLFVNLNILNILFFIPFFSLLNSQRLPHYFGVIYYSFFISLAYLLSLIKPVLIKRTMLLLFFTLYVGLNGKSYYFLYNPPNNQIDQAKNIANSIASNITSYPYQTVSLPNGNTDGHARYFLEISNNRPLPEDSIIQPEELFVLCFENECNILGSPQWQIAFFKNKKIDKIWTIEGVKIYKVTHAK